MNRKGRPASALSEPFVVEVRDQSNNPLAGAPVAFSGHLRRRHPLGRHRHHRCQRARLLHPDSGQRTGYQSPSPWPALELEPSHLHRRHCRKPSTDFDGDGETGFLRLLPVRRRLRRATDARFDLDGSGRVDFADFFLLADHFEDPARGKLLALARETESACPTARTCSRTTPTPSTAKR